MTKLINKKRDQETRLSDDRVVGKKPRYCKQPWENILYHTVKRKNIEDPLPGFMIRNKYKRSLVKSFKKTMSFRQTELLSSTDKNV